MHDAPGWMEEVQPLRAALCAWSEQSIQTGGQRQCPPAREGPKLGTRSLLGDYSIREGSLTQEPTPPQCRYTSSSCSHACRHCSPQSRVRELGPLVDELA